MTLSLLQQVVLVLITLAFLLFTCPFLASGYDPFERVGTGNASQMLVNSMAEGLSSSWVTGGLVMLFILAFVFVLIIGGIIVVLTWGNKK
jgi:hypothetical protein